MKHCREEIPAKPERKRRSGFGYRTPWYKKRITTGVFAVSAAVTLLITAYFMKLPAVTISYTDSETETHVHTAECYEKELICAETAEDHIHTDECYSDEYVLVCETDADEGDSNEAPSPTEIAEVSAGSVLDGCVDLEAFLDSIGGYIESDLYDKYDNLIDNIYEASGEGYSYQFTMYADYIYPGRYYYALHDNMVPDDESLVGSIYDRGVAIGAFSILPGEPYLFFDFGSEVNSLQNISGELSFGCSFAARMKPAVSKYGYLISPDNVIDGFFHFTIQAKIPCAGTGVPKREWTLTDRSTTTVITEQMADTKEWIHDFGSEINAPNTEITISYGDVEDCVLHDIRDVYDDDSVSIAYYPDSVSKSLYLVNRCICGRNHCVNSVNGECECELLSAYDGWCTCWNLDYDAELTIRYKNAVSGYDGKAILQDQKELSQAESANYNNTVVLKGKYSKDGEPQYESKMAACNVDYSAIVDKSEAVKATRNNGLKSTYRIVINPHMADLSKLDADGDGIYDEEVYIYDVMTNQKYINGSMTMTAADADGNSFDLDPENGFGVDAVQTDTGTRLTIAIKELGPWVYTIEYRAQTYKPDDNSDSVKISNDVAISFFGNEGGQNGEQDNPEYDFSRSFRYNDKWIFQRYNVQMTKYDVHQPQLKLEGAVYGLYSQDGTELARAVTDSSGSAEFQTDITNGLIFENDRLYYLQEIQAPEGYDVNTLRYWFYFRESRSEAIEAAVTAESPGADILLITPDSAQNYNGSIDVADERAYTLPETGGSGRSPLIFTGAVLIAAACLLACIKRRKYCFYRIRSTYSRMI